MTSRVIATWMRAMLDMATFQAKRFAFGAWLALLAACFVATWQFDVLIHQNRDRIADIQQSRFESCKTTYESFHAIFDPFVPPPGKRTPQQERDVARFDRLIDKKIRECRHQVTPPAIHPK